MLLLFSSLNILFCQSNELSLFDPLVGKTWKAEGNWGDGSPFSQEIEINYSLDSSIVLLNTMGYVNTERNKLGLRNHGIRQFDKETNQIKFWEYDVFGGLTEGIVYNEGKNIVYQYQYGDFLVTDMWKYVNDSTYSFKVGNFNDGQWEQIYIETEFKEVPHTPLEDIYSIMKSHLVGNWTSEAWDGILNESWSIDKNGHLTQTAQYIENEKVLFQSANKVELVNNELILFSVIKNGNPKIFKASSYSSSSVVFENSDYKNPDKLVYTFHSDKRFDRKISGIENGELSNYTFEFKRID